MGIGTAAQPRGGATSSRTVPARRARAFFDVDWTPVKAALHAKLLLPILGDQYGRVLERGELALEFLDGLLVVELLRPRAADQPEARAAACSAGRSDR